MGQKTGIKAMKQMFNTGNQETDNKVAKQMRSLWKQKPNTGQTVSDDEINHMLSSDERVDKLYNMMKGNVKENKHTIRLSESHLRRIIAESIKEVLKENLNPKELEDYYGDEYTNHAKKRDATIQFLLKVYPEYRKEIEEYADSGEDVPDAPASSRIASFEKFMENNNYFPL